MMRSTRWIAALMVVGSSTLAACYSPGGEPLGTETDGTEDGGTSAADGSPGSGTVDPGSADGGPASADGGSSSEGGGSEDVGSSPCDPSPCENGACSVIDDAAVCTCEPGFEGDDCSVDIDDCVGVECGNGACVDDVESFVCACDDGWAGPSCDELQMPLCLRGDLTVLDALDVVNGNPATGAFEHLEGGTIELVLRFDVRNTYTGIGGGGPGELEGQLRTLEANGFEVFGADNFVTDVFGTAYAGTGHDVVLVNGPSIGVYLGNLVSPSGPEYWGLESSAPIAIPLIMEGSGFPALLPSEGTGTGAVILRRYQTGAPQMTDFAQAEWAPALLNGPACD